MFLLVLVVLLLLHLRPLTWVMAMPLDKAVGMHTNTARPSLSAKGSSGSASTAGAKSGLSNRMEIRPYATVPA